jgi:MerR family transcriptional regulator, light-induced transcriptional regulator
MNEQSEHFDSDNEPIYNIGAVSRTTDIAETTLRVWERRYDFPNSSRTDGGHRLYSQNEVKRLQWVKGRMDKGMQVSQAIKALHRIEEDGRFADVQPNMYSTAPQNADVFAAFFDRLLKALLENDIALADRVIAEALTVQTLEHLILHIISPLMNEMGSLWERGELDIATEHLATNFLRQYLRQWMRTGPPPYNVNPVVLTCAPSELHEGSLLMLGVLLRRLRWPVSYLGQSIALNDFTTFVENAQPPIIVFVAMTEESAEALIEWPHWLPEAYKTNQPLVCFGGRIFTEDPDYVKHVPGMFLGKSLEEGISALNQLLIDIYPSAR